jgi:hypothetical protein
MEDLDPELGDLRKARAVYAVIRDIWIGGGAWLEPHERIGVLTVAAGIRSFTFLNHLNKARWTSTSAVLSTFGLECAPCDAYFDYELDAGVPDALVDLYVKRQLKYPLRGLGVWSPGSARPSIPLSGLGAALQYPQCCEAMDSRTKAHDHSVTLSQLCEDNGGKRKAIKSALESGTISLAWTEQRANWEGMLNITRAKFPFALHTACDDCIAAGDLSATAALSKLYERLTLAVSPELHLMVRWACEVCRISTQGDT